MPHGSSDTTIEQQKKKKKGRAPAHQNTFAFRHNPKSKKTATILEAPIEGVCRRCREKLEWRKRYRKYKPLTQPSKCNLCCQRNVRSAYHTLCAGCAQSSAKAVQFVQEWNQNHQQQNQLQPQDDEIETAASDDQQHPPQQDTSNTTAEESPSSERRDTLPVWFVATRVCAVCVQEPAMPKENDNYRDLTAQDSNATTTYREDRPLRLRELKTLERQRERAAAANKPQRHQPQQQHDDDDDDDDDDEQEDSQEEDDDDDGDNLPKGNSDYLAVNDEMDDADDPFLRAVGGADKLLTGEAYQKKLLLEQTQRARETSPPC